jgi:nucleoid DNA-binding protein
MTLTLYRNQKSEKPSPMTKRDLVSRISNETGMIQMDVQKVVQLTLDGISDAVAHGQKVELRNFGVFEVRTRKPRVGRNPNEPNSNVSIPSRTVVRFKPGKEMRESVQKLSRDGASPSARSKA